MALCIRALRGAAALLSLGGFAPIIPSHKYTTIVHTPVLVSLRWVAQALVICIPIPSGSRYRRDHKTGVYNHYDDMELWNTQAPLRGSHLQRYLTMWKRA